MKLYGHIVNQLARNFHKRLNEKISPLGIYASQWGIILYLYNKKQCTQVEISQYLGVEAPTITRTLSRMEEQGFIIRKAGKDKREKLIELTEKAYEMFPKLYEAASEVEEEARQGVTQEELDYVSSVLQKMKNNLD